MKPLRMFIIVFVFVLTNSFGDFEETWRKEQDAKAFFLAGKYERASRVYQEMLKGELSSYGKACVRYLLGSSFLAQKRWDDALRCYNKIVLNGERPPLFLKNICANKALALFRKAEEIFSGSDRKDSSFLDFCRRAADLLQEAIVHIEEAIKAERQINLLEGAYEGETSNEIWEVKKGVKRLILKILLEKRTYELENLNVREGLYFLLKELRGNIAHFEEFALQETPLASKLLYMRYFLYSRQSQRDVWRALHKILSEEHSGQEEKEQIRKVFIHAERYFQEALNSAEEGEFWEIRNGFTASELYLMTLIGIIEKRDIVVSLLQRRFDLAKKAKSLSQGEFLRSIIDQDRLLLETLVEQVVCASCEIHLGDERGEEREIISFLLKNFLFKLRDSSLSPWENFIQSINYIQIFEREEEGLEKICDELLPISEGKIGFSNEGRRLFFCRLSFIKEKFEVRSAIDEKRREQLEELVKILSIEENASLIEISDALEGALRIWAPEIFFGRRLKRLHEEIANVLEKSRFLDLGHLEALALEARSCIVRMKDSGLDLFKLERDMSRLLQNFICLKESFKAEEKKSFFLFLEDSIFWAEKILETLRRKEDFSASDVLKEGLKGQKALYQRSGVLENFREEKNKLFFLLRRLQNVIIEDLSFFEEIMENSSEKERKRIPWEDIMYFYRLGKERAEEVRESLDPMAAEEKELLEKNEEIIGSWQKALEMFQKPKNSRERQKEGREESISGFEEKKGALKDASSQENKKRALPMDVLQALQEMQREDSILRRKKSIPKQGERPW